MRTIKAKKPWLPHVHVDHRAELHELPSLGGIKTFEVSSEYGSDLEESWCTCHLKPALQQGLGNGCRNEVAVYLICKNLSFNSIMRLNVTKGGCKQ